MLYNFYIPSFHSVYIMYIYVPKMYISMIVRTQYMNQLIYHNIHWLIYRVYTFEPPKKAKVAANTQPKPPRNSTARIASMRYDGLDLSPMVESL